MDSQDSGASAAKPITVRRKAASTTGARLAGAGHKGKSKLQQNISARRDPFVNRELSLLAFNERVLAQAEDPQVPLLERLRYLTIVSNNLDEFFEIRVAELKQLADSPSASLETLQTLDAVQLRARSLVRRQYGLLNRELLPKLREQGVVIHLSEEWSPAQREWAEQFFHSEVEPLLTPIALDPVHPFPRVLNKSLNFVVDLDGRDAFGRDVHIAIVQAPRALPRVLSVPKEISGHPHGLMLLTSVVQGFMHRLFPGLKVVCSHQFRVTRNSDLYVDDEEVTDLKAALQDELVQRHFGDAVRIEVSAACPEPLKQRLREEFKLTLEDLYPVEGPVNLVRLQQVIELVDRSDLKFGSFMPAWSKAISASRNQLFDSILEGDVLLHHPYESFEPVQRFLSSAATDPHVVAIKQTVYRTGADSVLMASLIEAARRGKEVTVVLELMARFDEETNMQWASRLEAVGAHVVYGVVGHKTHAKMAMVIRREGRRLVRYVHLGTGNYHPRTAKVYEDFGLLTAHPGICADVHEVFRRLTGLGQAENLRHLAQAPFTLMPMVLESIAREIKHVKEGKRGLIRAKLNALIDPEVIEALYAASQAGVEVALIIRGVCALRPGVKGLSENIRVWSVIGRFLEHSRIYYFHNQGHEEVWLSSADWMQRNLRRRVEIAFPVLDAKAKKRVIEEGLLVHSDKNPSAWEMDAQGNYDRNEEAHWPKGSSLIRGSQSESQNRLLQRLSGFNES
ncbi:MAG: polyphosphate kinase 1 [Betaproteobacteria bacterium]